MSMHRRLTAWGLIASVAIVLAMTWVNTVLAEADGDGDGLDGDELVLPILIGAAVLAYIAWTTLRGRSRKSS